MAQGTSMQRAVLLMACAIGAVVVVGVRSTPTSGRDMAARDSVEIPKSGGDELRAGDGVPGPTSLTTRTSTRVADDGRAWLAGVRTQIDALPASEFFDLPYEESKPHRWKAKNWYCVGDFNRNDHVERSDAVLYLEVFASREGPYARYLDVNEDGWVDLEDLSLFLEASQVPCDPVERAETMLLRC